MSARRTLKGESVTAELRPVAMRLAAEWLAPSIGRLNPGLAKHFQVAKLFRVLKRNGGDSDRSVRVKQPRTAAETFVNSTLRWAEHQPPKLLIEKVPGGLNPLPEGPIGGPPPNPPMARRPVPPSGQAALLEVAGAIGAALREGAGRPMRIDPLIARETLAKVRKEHKRAPGRRQPLPIEKAAYQLGVSVDTVDRALPAGREAEEAIREALKTLPPGSTPLLVPVIYGEKPVVAGVVFSFGEPKKSPPG